MIRCNNRPMRRGITTPISLLLAAGAMLASSAPLSGQVASAILREGDSVGKGLAVAGISNTAVNANGGYAVIMNTGTLSHVWGSLTGGTGGVIRTEGVYSGLTQTAFEGFFGIGLTHVGYSPTGTGGPVGGFDSIFRDDDVVMVEGDPHPVLPGLFWRFGSRASVTSSGEVWFVGGTTTTAGGSTSNRGLFIGGPFDSVVLKGGDIVPGFAEPLNTATAVEFDFRVSNNGNHYIAPVVLTGGTAADGAVVLDGEAAMAGGSVLREGTVIPVSVGGNGTEVYAAFDFMGITNLGSWMATGDSNAATSADEFLMIDGMIVLRDGAVIGKDTVQGDIEGAYLNDDSDYAVIWDVSANTIEALIVNGQVMLREGDPVDWDGDGATDAGTAVTNFTGISSLTMTNRDRGSVSVYFLADVNVSGTVIGAAFRMDIQLEEVRCPCDWNDDMVLNSQDFFDFLTGFFNDAGDYNGDGNTNSQDFFDFMQCFFAADC